MSGYFARLAAHAHGTRGEGFASQNDAGVRSIETTGPFLTPSPPRPVGTTEFDAEMTQHPRVPGISRSNQNLELPHGTRSEGFASQNDAGGRSRRTQWMLGSTPPDVEAAGTFLTPSPRPRPVGSQPIMKTQTIKVPKVRYEAVHYVEEQVIQVPRMTYDPSVLEPKGLEPKYYEVPAGTGAGLRLCHRLSTAQSPAASVTAAFVDPPGATGAASVSSSSPPTGTGETLRAFFESPIRNR